MKSLKTTFAAGTAALVVAGGGAGAALACDGHDHDATASTMSVRFGADHHRFGRHFGVAFGQRAQTWNAVVSAVTDYLGLSVQQIKADLESGQTLAQIATTQQKDPNVLAQTIVNAIKPRLDAAVAAGRISSTQESAFLTTLTAKVTAVVNHQFTFGRHDADNDGD